MVVKVRLLARKGYVKFHFFVNKGSVETHGIKMVKNDNHNYKMVVMTLEELTKFRAVQE